MMRRLSTQARFAHQTASRSVQVVECPRDAMQGLPTFVPTADKIRYINKLLEVGFHTIDFGSFVSAPAVPQMRDTAEVLDGLDLAQTKSKLLAVVCNKRGAEDAAKYSQIDYLGFPLSISEEFQQRNTRRNIASAFDTLQQIADVCARSDKEMVTYISMAFGNPYGEAYNAELVSEFIEKVASMGVKTISLADTVGCGTAESIGELFREVLPRHPELVIGAHLHSSSATSPAKLDAVLSAGCNRIDGAIGGMGGCPFAKSALIGNVPTESVIAKCGEHGVDLGIDVNRFLEAQAIKHELFGVAVSEMILQCYVGDREAFSQLCKRHFEAVDVSKDGTLTKDEFTMSVRKVIDELGEEYPDVEAKAEKMWNSRPSPDVPMNFNEYLLLAHEKVLKKLSRGNL
eukprot:TRINITY_DN651_c0_g5_i1.p1 TRINITY_DN651_c0_g5~~TRINITY_DN651_c0_g5_i1.p1  ORF type:complete len:401 (+),score=137.07 TRINITY_DN651_c0_g5_i1:61-1263(+)